MRRVARPSIPEKWTGTVNDRSQEGKLQQDSPKIQLLSPAKGKEGKSRENEACQKFNQRRESIETIKMDDLPPRSVAQLAIQVGNCISEQT